MSTPAGLFDRMIVAVDSQRLSKTNRRDTAPAIVCGVNPNNVNLRVFYDGPDVGWLTGITVYPDEQTFRSYAETDPFAMGCWPAP